MKKVIILESETFDSTLMLGSHHLARAFKRNGWDVLWLGHYVHPLNLIDKREKGKHLVGWRKGVVESPEGILYYAPFTSLPYLRCPVLDGLFFARNALRFSVPPLGGILERHGFGGADLLFMNNIKLISVKKTIKCRKTLLRIPDDITGFNHHPRSIRALEEHAIRSSDKVICTTPNLTAMAKRLNPESYLIENGVDFEAFDKGGNDGVVPEDLAAAPAPRVLYVGAISHWLDIETLKKASARLADVSIVFIGPILDQNMKKELQGGMNRNFYYLGRKDFTQLPSYIKNCAAGLIPFKRDDFTNEISPLKMFEYLACGKPVVSAGINQVLRYSGSVKIYSGEESLAGMIRQAIAEGSARSDEYRALAARNSWTGRFNQIMGLCGL